jgi:hypothetical protein
MAPYYCMRTIHKSHNLLEAICLALARCLYSTVTDFCHVYERGPCSAKADFISLARVYWSGGNTHRPGSSVWPTQDEVFPRYCRDVSARLLFSMLAIYSLDSSSLAAPLLWFIQCIYLPIYTILYFTVASFALARVTGSTGSSLSGAAHT